MQNTWGVWRLWNADKVRMTEFQYLSIDDIDLANMAMDAADSAKPYKTVED